MLQLELIKNKEQVETVIWNDWEDGQIKEAYQAGMSQEEVGVEAQKRLDNKTMRNILSRIEYLELK